MNRTENRIDDNNIILYLCGFMGCGKSTIGEAAAKKLGIPFVDLDKHIEEKSRKNIADIFRTYGEEHFRELEAECVLSASEILSRNNSGGIIALGGGAILKKENTAVINKYGLSVYIDVEFNTCYERIKNDPKRPIADGKLQVELETLYEMRKDIYSQKAKQTIDGNTTVENITERLIAIYNVHLQRENSYS